MVHNHGHVMERKRLGLIPHNSFSSRSFAPSFAINLIIQDHGRPGSVVEAVEVHWLVLGSLMVTTLHPHHNKSGMQLQHNEDLGACVLVCLQRHAFHQPYNSSSTDGDGDKRPLRYEASSNQ